MGDKKASKIKFGSETDILLLGWKMKPDKAVRIKDNREILVDIKKYCHGVKIAINSGRIKKEKTAYLRLTVAKMLAKARRYLPKGMNFIIGDAWRSAFVQAKIYYSFIGAFRRRYPKWPQRKIVREVQNYVAPWFGNGASGHMSGGAIDLRLTNNHGQRIPMKSKKLSYQENGLSDQKKLPKYIQRNREILFSAMRKAGFSNYSKEYWHWSFGDYYWAIRNKKRVAIYGPVAGIHHIYEKEKCPCNSGKEFVRCHGE